MHSAGYLSATAGTTSLTLTSEDIIDSVSALAEAYSRPDAAGVCVADPPPASFLVLGAVSRRPWSGRCVRGFRAVAAEFPSLPTAGPAIEKVAPLALGWQEALHGR
jgi:hypothetical protein